MSGVKIGFFLTCPVLTYLLLYLHKNKCGSGHRKLRVCVVKNPDHISAYITFLNSLQPPRTKELVFLCWHTIVHSSIISEPCCTLVQSLVFPKPLLFDRQTDHPTDRLMKGDIKAPTTELKNLRRPSHIFITC